MIWTFFGGLAALYMFVWAAGVLTIWGLALGSIMPLSKRETLAATVLGLGWPLLLPPIILYIWFSDDDSLCL